MTDRPSRAIKLGRIQVRFFVKRGIERTPTQQPAGAVAPLCVSTPEATTFDLIRYATSIGGIERAAETIGPLLPILRARELKRMLDAENEPAVTQRLGFVIEAGSAKKLAKVVRDWLPDKLAAIPLSPIKGYDIHEMLGTKMRAMFQRKRGRDLFDLYWALTKSTSPIDPLAIIESFQHYLKQEGTKAGRAEFVGILNAHLKDRGFCSDMEPLLRHGISYNPQAAGSYIKANLLSLLPE
jgi:hypothetical protein